MTSRWWTPLSIILILLSFIVFAFLSRRPLCIDSKFVEKIDRVSDAALPATVYRCGLHRAVPFDEKWSELVIPLSRRLQRAEKFLDSLAPQLGLVRITVSEKDRFLYKIEGHDIFLGETVLASQGSLEKALIKVWVQDHANTQLGDHPVFEESLSDLLLFAIDGDLNIQNSDLKISPMLEKVERWPFVVKSMAGYCHSPWRQFEHHRFCQSESLDKGLHDSNVIPLSLRPLLTQSMVASYLSLTSRERRRFLERLPTFLTRFRFDDKNFGFTSIDSNQQGFVDVSFELSGIMRALAATVKVMTDSQPKETLGFKKWSSHLSDQLQDRGFSDQAGEAQLDHLVVLMGVNSDRHISALSKVAEKMQSAAVAMIEKDQIFLLPSVEPVKKNLFGRLRAQKMTLLNCGGITLSDLDAYSEVTDKIIVIENCDEAVSINFEGLLKGEVGRFSLQNPQVGFVEVHLPSLHLALAKKRLNSSLQLALNFDNVALNQTLGWQRPTYDSSIRAYRSHSAIEAFQTYRPSRAPAL